NAGMLLGGRSVNALLGLGFMALGARGLGVTQFGVLVLIHAFAQFLGDVVKFQSWQTVLNYGARPLKEGRKADFQRVLRFAVVLDLASGVLGVAIGVAGAFLFAGKLGLDRQYAPAAAGYIFSVFFMVSAAPLGLLRLLDRFDLMAHQTALVSLVRLIGSAIAYALHAPLSAYLLAWGLGPVVGFVYLTIGCWRELKRHDLLSGFVLTGPLTAGMPGIWRFAWATNLSATLEVAFTHLVTLVVGAMVGPAGAGLWRIGAQIADAVAKPAKLLVPALYPELARLHASRNEGTMWRLALQVGLLGGGVGAVLLVVSVFAGAPLLDLIMGHGFAAAAHVMTWQVAAAVIGILALPLEPMLVSLGKAGAAMRVRLVVSVAFLASLSLILHRFGLVGAGAGLVGAAVALGLGMGWILLRGREAGASRKKTLAMREPDA
ncbi:MAG: putative rane protein involved in the export of O-antigen and teichoic acid, partial [Caulobacteraceae bacterium]|nr:putative rane protein involved in the export of O-antigen and teichoic acid [Caulobacteraceae bacterium]